MIASIKNTYLHSQQSHIVPEQAFLPRSLLINNAKRGYATACFALGTISRKAYDVAVIGGGILGTYAAQTISQTGRKVLVIENFGLEGEIKDWGNGIKPIRVANGNPHAAYLAAESLRLWRDVERQVNSTSRELPALDFARVIGDSSAEGQALDLLEASCQELKLQYDWITGDQLHSLYPPLRVPAGVRILRQPSSAGLIEPKQAQAFLKAQAVRTGVDVRPSLLGWQDAGSYFKLRVGSTTLGDELVAEVEQLLLAPGPALLGPSLRLFGLALPGLRTRVATAGLCSFVDSDRAARLPLARCLGLRREDEDTSGKHPSLNRFSLFPVQSQHVAVSQLLLDGQLQDPLSLAPLPPAADALDALSLPDGTAPRLLGLLHRPAGRGQSVYAVEAEGGEAVLGSHPGFEPGRVILAVAACGTGLATSFDPFQLTPALAMGAAQLLTTDRLTIGDPAKLSPVCDDLEADTTGLSEGWDTWEELKKLLVTGSQALQEQHEEDT